MSTVLESSIINKRKTFVENRAEESKENIKRTLLKTISWRIVGTLTTMIISYLITGTLALAFSIGVVELISKMGLYFFHERAWDTIKWGK